MWSVSESRFEDELKKCQILCSECHDRKTCGDNNMRYAIGTHGTVSSYRHCGPPKCEACKKAKAENQRQRRASLRGEEVITPAF